MHATPRAATRPSVDNGPHLWVWSHSVWSPARPPPVVRTVGGCVRFHGEADRTAMRGAARPAEHELAPRRRATPCGPASRLGAGPSFFWGVSWVLRSSEGGVRMAERQAEVRAVEGIKKASRGLRGSLAPELAAGTSHFEDETAQLLKFHGVYQQDDRDARRQRSDAGLEPQYAFMVRCKIPGGVLTARQYLALDELAGRYGNGKLRGTTRQDKQFHGVGKGGP